MHIQFLVEDQSGEILIRQVMNKLLSDRKDHTFDVKHFQGIGGYKVCSQIKDVKNNKMLHDLPIVLKGFDNKYKSNPNYPALIVVVLDNDDRCTEDFEKQLTDMTMKIGIMTDHVICIAVEEMEAWLLGDRKALLQAYPGAHTVKLKDYQQDKICGTWEILADAVYEGGMKKFIKACPTFHEIGKCKAEWAEKIGSYMILDDNVSPSFQYFLSEIRKRIAV